MTPGWSRTLVGSVSSLFVWGLHFAAVYALVGVGCEAGWDRAPLAGMNRLTAVLIAATVPAVAAIAWIGWSGWRLRRAARRARTADDGPERARFMGLLTAVIAITALVATLMTVLPALMLPPCALN